MKLNSILLVFLFQFTPLFAQKKFSPKQIEETTKLVLQMQDLTELPENVCQLINLEKIYISNNNIGELPDCLSELTKLREIMMTDNKFTLFPEVLCSITSLEGIGLNGARIKEIPASIGNLINLQALEMDTKGKGIEVIPIQFANLIKLKILLLKTCGFDSIPDYFVRFTELTELFYSDDSLETIPDSIGNLIHLNRFVLRGRYPELPESFGDLKALSYLELTSDSLRALPGSFSQLSQLRKLKFYGCPVQRFPESLCEIYTLEELHFFADSEDKLNWQTLPAEIESMSSLKKLTLRHVGLNHVPPHIGSCSQLTELDLSYNNLTTFPAKILPYLRNLERLNIAFNKLSDESLQAIQRGVPDGCLVAGVSLQD